MTVPLAHNDSLDLSILTAVSPLDGRYYEKVKDRCCFFSEYGLIRYRVLVEVRWFLKLSEIPEIIEVLNFSDDAKLFLKNLVRNFSPDDASEVKKIEKVTNHEVKAVKYSLKDKCKPHADVGKVLEFFHFACTSENINNLAHGLMLRDAINLVMLPIMDELINFMCDIASKTSNISMLSRAHGQVASPTTLEKEFAVFSFRLNNKKKLISQVKMLGKFACAVGNYNAHLVTYPNIDWPKTVEEFVESFRLSFNPNVTQAVHTQAKILGDQDVMYKYFSKNLLFVTTVSPKASGCIGSCTPDEAWLVAYLIDTVTGRILHRVTHLGAQGPINAVFSENWVVYHYFNLRAHRYEISVMEIYDESRADNKDVLRLMFGKHNLTMPISSYSRPKVTVKAQSYFFTHSVKTMAVTATVKGITSKQLLIGTISDQVLALDKRFLDPGRTHDPSPSEREEGIIPLTDALPIIPQSYITHSLQVEGLRGIVTVPSRLESTALVFTYGMDVFFTRIAPSRTYDSLTEDFSYALITIIALVGAIIATWILSDKKELREKR